MSQQLNEQIRVYANQPIDPKLQGLVSEIYPKNLHMKGFNPDEDFIGGKNVLLRHLPTQTKFTLSQKNDRTFILRPYGEKNVDATIAVKDYLEDHKILKEDDLQEGGGFKFSNIGGVRQRISLTRPPSFSISGSYGSGTKTRITSQQNGVNKLRQFKNIGVGYQSRTLGGAEPTINNANDVSKTFKNTIPKQFKSKGQFKGTEAPPTPISAGHRISFKNFIRLGEEKD